MDEGAPRGEDNPLELQADHLLRTHSLPVMPNLGPKAAPSRRSNGDDGDDVFIVHHVASSQEDLPSKNDTTSGEAPSTKATRKTSNSNNNKNNSSNNNDDDDGDSYSDACDDDDDPILPKNSTSDTPASPSQRAITETFRDLWTSIVISVTSVDDVLINPVACGSTTPAKLGQGISGSVCEMLWIQDGKDPRRVAVKTLRGIHPDRLWQNETLNRELRFIAATRTPLPISIDTVSSNPPPPQQQQQQNPQSCDITDHGHPGLLAATGVIYESSSSSVHFLLDPKRGNLASGPAGRPMPEALAAHVALQLLEALAHLHETLGFAHQDIKPDNILYTDEGDVILTDWGLSQAVRIFAPSTSSPSASASGAPANLSPGQASAGAGTARRASARQSLLCDLVSGTTAATTTAAERDLWRRTSQSVSSVTQPAAGARLRRKVSEALSYSSMMDNTPMETPPMPPTNNATSDGFTGMHTVRLPTSTPKHGQEHPFWSVGALPKYRHNSLAATSSLEGEGYDSPHFFQKRYSQSTASPYKDKRQSVASTANGKDDSQPVGAFEPLLWTPDRMTARRTSSNPRRLMSICDLNGSTEEAPPENESASARDAAKALSAFSGGSGASTTFQPPALLSTQPGSGHTTESSPSPPKVMLPNEALPIGGTKPSLGISDAIDSHTSPTTITSTNHHAAAAKKPVPAKSDRLLRKLSIDDNRTVDNSTRRLSSLGGGGQATALTASSLNPPAAASTSISPSAPPLTAEVLLRRFAGTPLYMPPESLRSELRRGTPTDIWALGVTIARLVLGQHPFYDALGGREVMDHPDTEARYWAMLSFFEKGQRDGIDKLVLAPLGVSEELRSFLALCWRMDANERASASQLLDHPWIRQQGGNTALLGRPPSPARRNVALSPLPPQRQPRTTPGQPQVSVAGPNQTTPPLVRFMEQPGFIW